LKATGISIEIDEETGLLFHYDMGAFGSAPNMPRDIALPYLSDQIISAIEEKSIR
jgi:hypothetical protein